MIKKFFLLFFIISLSFSQVIPIDALDEINIDDIPQNIPSIDSNELNVSFNEHAISIINSLGKFSYLMIKSNFIGNYQIEINHANLPHGSYLAFYDKNLNCLYGPYNSINSEIIFPSVMNGEEVVLIYFEPYYSEFNGNFIIDSIYSIENIFSNNEIPNYNVKQTRERPILMVTGYWPPTNEMLRHFSQNLELNPDGWQGENWRDSGFDVVSFFPEFDPPDCNNCGQGYGDFEVDYQDTSSDFWRIIEEVKPSGIITFSRGFNNNSWELENNVYNWTNWYADYTPPLYPTPSPPDDSVADNHNRGTALPIHLIEEVLDNSDININCYIDQNGDAGKFLSEFMGYHGMWYHQSSLESDMPCMLGGHIHVGGQLSTRTAKDAAELTIEVVLGYLDQMLVITGDINNDHIINVQDVIMLINYILENNEPNQDWLNIADLNNDEQINVQDVILLVELALN